MYRHDDFINGLILSATTQKTGIPSPDSGAATAGNSTEGHEKLGAEPPCDPTL